MKRFLQIAGISVLAILFLATPLLSSSVHKAGGAGVEIHPATYHYNYRYYRPVKEGSGSRQCYWLYTNGSYVYVCR